MFIQFIAFPCSVFPSLSKRKIRIIYLGGGQIFILHCEYKALFMKDVFISVLNFSKILFIFNFEVSV